MKNILISRSLLNCMRYLPLMILLFFFIITSNNLKASEVTCSTITISWTAPGDDNNQGTADKYDIRYSTSAITETNWNIAIQISDEPAPQLAGSQESYTIEDLEPGTTYYFAIKTSDEASNWSALSNIGSAATSSDTEAPDAIADLQITNLGEHSVTLTWTATGDDGGEGTANLYYVRYAVVPITEANWDSISQASDEPIPQPAGNPETFTVNDLQSQTTYYFAIKTADEALNWSGLSNIVSGMTPDLTLPMPIYDLIAVTGENAGEIDICWTAPGDDSLTGLASEYIIKTYSGLIQNISWDSAATIANPPTPVEPGSLQTFTITGLEPAQLHFVAIKTIDDYGNISDISVIDSATSMFDWSQDSIYENSKLPDRFALEQNYPNPFNPSTNINFSLPEPADVKLDIYNSIGQKVITLVESNYPAGFYTERWNGKDAYDQSLASGVYFYIIQAGQFADTKKMMLIK